MRAVWRAIKYGTAAMVAVTVLSLFLPVVAVAVHALLTVAVAAACLVPAGVLVTRAVAVIRERRANLVIAVGEQSSTDYGHLAGRSATASLRESA